MAQLFSLGGIRTLHIMSRKVHYLIGVPVIAILWIPVSFFILGMLMDAEDPPDGQPASASWLLRVVWDIISFPMKELTPLGWIRVHFGDRGLERAVYSSFFIDGLLWGFIFVFLFRCAVPFFRRRMLGNHDAA